MNHFKQMLQPWRLLYRLGVEGRLLLPPQACSVFGNGGLDGGIERIYVINLDRQPARWRQIQRELDQVLDAKGHALTKRTVRVPAVDGASFAAASKRDLPASWLSEVQPTYSLREQLAVEPQPRVLPDRFELDQPIPMSWPEVAVARSHIAVWRLIAQGDAPYALVMEDDAYVHRGFGRYLNRAWAEMLPKQSDTERFDICYLSYKEVKGGAQKALLSRSVFRPVCGLWYLSGYVLSRAGAQKLLAQLPCRGPVDLWINLQFSQLEVRATRRSLISQRSDGISSNSYSILPILSRIGLADWGSDALFPMRPPHQPVFAFGEPDSGLTSLAMALLILGYRCVSDLDRLPASEHRQLLAGSADRVFDAYVNIGSLREHAKALKERYTDARFIVAATGGGSATGRPTARLEGVAEEDVCVLQSDAEDKWTVICEHLKCPPPACSFPTLSDLRQRRLLEPGTSDTAPPSAGKRRHDPSPWVVTTRGEWKGVELAPSTAERHTRAIVQMHERMDALNTDRWETRDDTFPGNLAMFRSANVSYRVGVGAVLTVRPEHLGVRDYSAGAISSRQPFLFGRFEATLRAAKASGLVTGFFLHRDSPRQEIDVEIVGKHTDRLLVNVFYNPGEHGASFDYGYRGTPTVIELGFDASEASHRYCIEWGPNAIRWLVDGQVVHERVEWNPTPIPRLPMILHANLWPSRSRELAGRLDKQRLPAFAIVESIAVTSPPSNPLESQHVVALEGIGYHDTAT